MRAGYGYKSGREASCIGRASARVNVSVQLSKISTAAKTFKGLRHAFAVTHPCQQVYWTAERHEVSG